MGKLEWTEAEAGWVAETPEGIHLRLTIEPDDTPVEGNAMASGDDAADAEYEQAIIKRLEDGDAWAWASVTVRASFKTLEGFDGLGSCCYPGFDEFAACDGYLPDMVEYAIDELIKNAKTARADSVELLARTCPPKVS